MTDALQQLFAFRWREVEIPISKTKMTLAHDLVEHKYWGVDGARIEDVGLAPIRIHATIPLQNGIVPGKTEHWSQVYPTLLRSLVSAFSKREAGLLQHPEYGNMICRAEHLEIDWDAMRRGGCDAEASWVEAQDDRAAAQRPKSPINEMEGAARDFDAANRDAKGFVKSELKRTGLGLLEYEQSFESMMNEVAGVFDQAAIIAGKPQALINRITYRAQQVQDAAERAETALAWPLVDAAERMRGAAAGLRQQLVEGNREIGLFRVPADTTLAGVKVQLPEAELVDLIRLNPNLMRECCVKAGSVVRFFGKAIGA